MSKHHNKHPQRGKSNYPRRLRKRGLSKAPVMETLEALRVRQQRREDQTGFPFWTSGADES